MYTPPPATNPFGLPSVNQITNFLGFGQQPAPLSIPPAPESPVYAPGSPAYAPPAGMTPIYAPSSPVYAPPAGMTPIYAPSSPIYAPGSPAYAPPGEAPELDVGDESLNAFFKTLPMKSKEKILNLKTQRDQKLLLNMVKQKYQEKNKIQPSTTENIEDILNIKDEKEEKEEKDGNDGGKDGNNENTKRITIG